MSGVYAREEDSGRRCLLRLECSICSATIRPHPEIARSGWTKRGTSDTEGGINESYYCPEHS